MLGLAAVVVEGPMRVRMSLTLASMILYRQSYYTLFEYTLPKWVAWE
jgi:hypothetical protein